MPLAATHAASSSEHPVRIGRTGGQDLQHVPVLDELATAVEPEDVDPGIIVAARPVLEAVQDDEIALGDHPLDVHALAGIRSCHSLEIGDEALRTGRHVRVVLDIVGPT